MFSPSDVLGRLEAVGVTVAVVGPDLVLRPGDRVPVDLIPAIREAKPELIRWLAPLPGFGPQAVEDAKILATIIDRDPGADLPTIRSRAEAAGITGARFACGLVALPEKFNRAN